MYKLYCRLYQSLFRLFSYLLPWREPVLLEGNNSVLKLPEIIKAKGIPNVLIVTGSTLASIGILNNLLTALEKSDIKYFIYSKTTPNPTIDNIEEALVMYKENNCSGIIAFGGGSPIDCAKGVGARVARPNKSIPSMKGVLKVRKKIPPFFAVPTTAGTGSETTIAAVVTNSKTHEKYAINDMALIPDYAVLDPLLTINLPKHITSTTGMDALTHAVEAYIGKSNTAQTLQQSKDAVRLIFENLYLAYSHGDNLVARANMQKASFLAGLAFTRAYVGNVHAIAHTLGGYYSIPHGLANAVILPYVLEFYGESAHKPLSELAKHVGLCSSTNTPAESAAKFIEAIKNLNESMEIPTKISGILENDVPKLVKQALSEANPLYPVPKIMTKADAHALYNSIRE